MPTSLVDFAAKDSAKHRPGIKCFMCELPEKVRREAEQGVVAAGVTKASLVRWLKSLGYPASDNKVGHHFREHDLLA